MQHFFGTELISFGEKRLVKEKRGFRLPVLAAAARTGYFFPLFYLNQFHVIYPYLAWCTAQIELEIGLMLDGHAGG